MIGEKEKMLESIQPRWLAWAREIQSLSQTGLHYAQDDYQRERYRRLSEIASEIVAEYSTLEPGELFRFFSAQQGYATPKVDVRGAVFHQEKLLLVRERSDGGWSMPGGWADVGDIPSKAAEREVWEEAGCRVSARKLIGVYDANRTGPLELFHAFKIVFLCDYLGGEPGSSAETSEAAFFGSEELPTRLSGERTRPRHILDAFAALAKPDLPAVFD
jgi:ADP-ribose pyrophosphatase YjhB (NUDIX family)